MATAGRCLLNDRLVAISSTDHQLVLSWLRTSRGLAGTKEGCGEGECGACTVLLGEPTPGGSLEYRAVASCLVPVGELVGRHLVTVEGLNPPTGLNPIQQALVEAGAPQCGFCFPGIVVSLAGFFLASDDLSPDRALTALDGNICRCTGYAAIRRAVEDICRTYGPGLGARGGRVGRLVAAGFLPAMFADAPTRLTGQEEDDVERGPGGVVIAGGTDLLVQQPEILVDQPITYLSRQRRLGGIDRELDHLRLGGGVTVAQLGDDPAFGALVPDAPDIVARFASTLIRNRATIAGNLVNASPIGDVSILLLALDAGLVLADGTARRTVPLGEFYLGYKKLARRPGELIESVRVPVSVQHDVVSFEKVSQRRILDIASVNSAARATVDEGAVTSLTLTFGGVAPIPLVAAETARCLIGRALDSSVLREAMDVLEAEIAPIDDVRGSAAYKRELARRLLVAHALRWLPGELRFEDLV